MGTSMDIRIIADEAGLGAAARIAADAHERLRRSLPFLPPRDESRYLPKIAWIAREGLVLGLYRDGALAAFLGGFVLDDFRNAGRGAYCPDWCSGVAEGAEASFAYRALYREAAPRWRELGAGIHALGLYSTDAAALEAMSLTGFGRIMADAARPAAELAAALGTSGPGAARRIRRASPEDAARLASLNASLASHIAASPVLLPRARGRDASWWAAWLAEPGSVAFVAERGGETLGYVKAEAPQDDVTDAVRDASVLGIDGMFVEPGARRAGVGRELLRALAGHALGRGVATVSVDFETMNPEAYGFWTPLFRIVSWGLERRT